MTEIHENSKSVSKNEILVTVSTFATLIGILFSLIVLFFTSHWTTYPFFSKFIVRINKTTVDYSTSVVILWFIVMHILRVYFGLYYISYNKYFGRAFKNTRSVLIRTTDEYQEQILINTTKENNKQISITLTKEHEEQKIITPTEESEKKKAADKRKDKVEICLRGFLFILFICLTSFLQIKEFWIGINLVFQSGILILYNLLYRKEMYNGDKEGTEEEAKSANYYILAGDCAYIALSILISVVLFVKMDTVFSNWIYGIVGAYTIIFIVEFCTEYRASLVKAYRDVKYYFVN